MGQAAPPKFIRVPRVGYEDQYKHPHAENLEMVHPEAYPQYPAYEYEAPAPTCPYSWVFGLGSCLISLCTFIVLIAFFIWLAVKGVVQI